MNKYDLNKKIPTIDWLRTKFNIIIKYQILPHNVKGIILKRYNKKYIIINNNIKNDNFEYMNFIYEILDNKDNILFEIITKEDNIIKSNTIKH